MIIGIMGTKNARVDNIGKYLPPPAQIDKILINGVGQISKRAKEFAVAHHIPYKRYYGLMFLQYGKAFAVHRDSALSTDADTMHFFIADASGNAPMIMSVYTSLHRRYTCHVTEAYVNELEKKYPEAAKETPNA
ncbi:MAG: hypothetical protein IJ766_09530 [Clostridia bacterium]|nr:hypothetical protein [Clostridia bacterium]